MRQIENPYSVGMTIRNGDVSERYVPSQQFQPHELKYQPFCMALFKRANKAFYANGITHKVSIRSISIMVILFWLWENVNPENLTEPRLLTSNAIEQMRMIVENEQAYPPEDVREIRGGRLFWTM